MCPLDHALAENLPPDYIPIEKVVCQPSDYTPIELLALNWISVEKPAF